MLKKMISGHQAIVMIVLALLCLWSSSVVGEGSNEDAKQWLFDRSGFFELSQTRANTNGLPIKAKCDHYDSTIQTILPASKEEHKVLRFAKVVLFLDQKVLPFKNPSVVLAELKECQEIFRHTNSHVNENDTDQSSSAVAMKAIRRELEETKRAAARDREQLAKLKKKLEEERQSAARTREDTKLASIVDKANMEVGFESRLKNDALQREVKSVKAPIKSEIARLKSDHEIELRQFEQAMELARWRESRLKQPAAAAESIVRALKDEIAALKTKLAQQD